MRRHATLLQLFDNFEQRLPLWLPLSPIEKLEMIMSQRIPEEAAILSTLFDAQYKRKGLILRAHVAAERSLDSMIYEKYDYLTDLASMSFREQTLEKEIEKDTKYNLELFKYIQFIVGNYDHYEKENSNLKRQFERIYKLLEKKKEKSERIQEVRAERRKKKRR